MEVFSVNSQEEFENKVLNSNKPVLADFYAAWCGAHAQNAGRRGGSICGGNGGTGCRG